MFTKLAGCSLLTCVHQLIAISVKKSPGQVVVFILKKPWKVLRKQIVAYVRSERERVLRENY